MDEERSDSNSPWEALGVATLVDSSCQEQLTLCPSSHTSPNELGEPFSSRFLMRALVQQGAHKTVYTL